MFAFHLCTHTHTGMLRAEESRVKYMHSDLSFTNAGSYTSIACVNLPQDLAVVDVVGHYGGGEAV